MGITSALVLFAVVWFMTFLMAIPIGTRTQGDEGNIVPGTHAGSPEHHHLKKKAFWTTIVSLVVWGLLCLIITSGRITVDDIENIMGGNPATRANETDE